MESTQDGALAPLDNHVYLYTPVTDATVGALYRSMQELDAALHYEATMRQTSAAPIWLHIHSPGGDLFAGLAMTDNIVSLHCPVYSVIEGYAASAATMISVACTRRFIRPNSFMLIHQMSSQFWGTFAQFQDEMHLQDMVMQKMIALYANYSNLTKKQVKKRLQRDYWLDAQAALDTGFVDEILRGAVREV